MKTNNGWYYFLIICLLFMISCNETETDTNTLDDSTFKVFKGATLFDGTGNIIENSIIVVKDNRIHKVGTTEDIVPEQADIIDVSGKFITPGMVDAHIHFFQTAFFDSRPDALNLRDSLSYDDVFNYQKNNPQRYYEAYLRSGVTAVYDVGDFNWTLKLDNDSTNQSSKPHIAAAGPLLTPVPEEYIKGFNVDSDTVMIHLGSPEIGVDHVIKNTQRGSQGIKIWSLTENDSTFMTSLRATAQKAQELNNPIIAHATTLNQAKAALEVGAHLLVHSVSDTLIDDEFIGLAKQNNVYYNPTLIVAAGYNNTYKAMLGDGFKINDQNNVVDEKTKNLLNNAHNFSALIPDTSALRARTLRGDIVLLKDDSIMKANLKKLYEAGVKIVVGTDAGNPGTLHGISIYDELEAMQAAGIPAADLIVMATKNGAEAMQREDEFGTVEANKIADFIILDQNPSKDIANMKSLIYVVRNGKIIDVKVPFD